MKQALMRSSSAIAFSLMVAAGAFGPAHAQTNTAAATTQNHAVAYVSEDGQSLLVNGQQYVRDDDGKPGALYYSANGDGKTLRINDNGVAVSSDGRHFDIMRRTKNPDPRPLNPSVTSGPVPMPPSNMPTTIKPPLVPLPPSNMPTTIKPPLVPLPPSNMPTTIKPPLVPLPPSNMPTTIKPPTISLPPESLYPPHTITPPGTGGVGTSAPAPTLPPLTVDNEGTISHNPLPPTSLPPKLPPIIDDGGAVFTPNTRTPAPAHYGKPDWNPNTRQLEWDSLTVAQKADWLKQNPTPGTKESLPKPIAEKPIAPIAPVPEGKVANPPLVPGNGYTIDRKGVVTDKDGNYAFTHNTRTGKYYDGKAEITDPTVLARFTPIAEKATKVKNAPKAAKKGPHFNSDGSIFYDAKGTPYYKDGDIYYDHSGANNNLTEKDGKLVDQKGKVYGDVTKVKQALTPIVKQPKEPITISLPKNGTSKKLAHGYSVDSKGVIKNPNGGIVGLIDEKGAFVDDKGKALPATSQNQIVSLFTDEPIILTTGGEAESVGTATETAGAQAEEKVASQKNAYVAATDSGEISYPGRADGRGIAVLEAVRKKASEEKKVPIVKAPPAAPGLQLPPPGYVKRSPIGLTLDEKGNIRGTAGQPLGRYIDGRFLDASGAPVSDQQAKEWNNAFQEAAYAPAGTVLSPNQPAPSAPPAVAPSHYGRSDWNPNTRQLEWNSLTDAQKTDWLKNNPAPGTSASLPGVQIMPDGQSLYMASGAKYVRDDDGQEGALYYAEDGSGKTLRVMPNGNVVDSAGKVVAKAPAPKTATPPKAPGPDIEP